jgi:hypothetical protein
MMFTRRYIPGSGMPIVGTARQPTDAPFHRKQKVRSSVKPAWWADGISSLRAMRAGHIDRFVMCTSMLVSQASLL